MNDDSQAIAAAVQWHIRPGVTYLNHGSYGPPPEPVATARAAWQATIDADPMDFFVHRLEAELAKARQRLARFVGASERDLVFVENSTYGMNIVARSFELRADDEVLLTDHEYGAVERIWQRRCGEVGARVVIAPLPRVMDDTSAVVEAIAQAVTPRTRLAIVSHVTSPTGIILPIDAINRRLRELGVALCVDGPHAVAMLPLDLAQLDCDYYVASCHKWLSAPFGSGFLYVAPRRQARVEPIAMSWGYRGAAKSRDWRDEFTWTGTRDPSPALCIPTAIDFLESVGLDAFRRRTHELARTARREIVALTGLEPPVPDDPAWYGPMLSLPIPDGDDQALHRALWERHQIEAATMIWQGRRFIRPCFHLYNRQADIERLVAALRTELGRE